MANASHWFRFRWVELQLATFLGPNAKIILPKDVLRKIERLDRQTGLPELDEIYEEKYQTNTDPASESRSVAVRTYKWVLAAERPLLLSELVEAVSYKQDGPPDAEISGELILTIYSNFLLEDTAHVIQFCHLSAREFLEERRTDSIPDYPYDLIHSQAAISSLAHFNNVEISDIDFRSPKSGFHPGSGFYRYAVDFVMVHLEKSKEYRKQDLLCIIFRNFLYGSPTSKVYLFSDWMEALTGIRRDLNLGNHFELLIWRLSCSRSNYWDPSNLVFLACVWGFREILEEPSHRVELNPVNFSHAPPLILACANGHHDIVLYLLQRGADVNCMYWGTADSPLLAAARTGKEQIVRTLIEWGAAIDLRSAGRHQPTSALGAAAWGGRFSIFKLLFEFDADKGNYDGALFCAVVGGKREIINLLLDARADAGSSVHDGTSPLEEAACEGMTDVVRRFLEHGTYSTAFGQHWSNPLKICSTSHHGDEAKSLLLQDLDIGCLGSAYSQAYRNAIVNGHLEVMEVLFGHGEPLSLEHPSSLCRYGCHSSMTRKQILRALLHDAAESLKQESISFLLKTGADIKHGRRGS